MHKPFDRKTVRFYLVSGLAFLSITLLPELATNTATFFSRVINNIWRICYLLPLNFFLFEYVVAYILQKRRFILSNIMVAFGMLLLLLMLYSWGLYAWRLFGIGLGIYTPFKTGEHAESSISQQMGFSMSSVFFIGIVRHVYHYNKLKRSAQQLTIEKQQAELNFLKSQTNPHFLFNTLNNIYSLARDKSDLAPESILRLSKMLRFILYETGGEYIAVEQELKIISDYISLEQLRYDDSLRVNFNHDIEDMKQAIPPLLLIPLVENAFKHGVSETRGIPFVEIHLSIRNRQLIFVVKNSSEGSATSSNVTEHIGLSNLRRQLHLLYSDYKLSVEQGQSIFTATLKINLASHL